MGDVLTIKAHRRRCLDRQEESGGISPAKGGGPRVVDRGRAISDDEGPGGGCSLRHMRHPGPIGPVGPDSPWSGASGSAAPLSAAPLDRSSSWTGATGSAARPERPRWTGAPPGQGSPVPWHRPERSRWPELLLDRGHRFRGTALSGPVGRSSSWTGATGSAARPERSRDRHGGDPMRIWDFLRFSPGRGLTAFRS